MRYIFALILLSLSLSIVAEELDLGQITIEGEGTFLADSLITIERFSETNGIIDNKIFSYEPEYFTTQINQPRRLDGTKIGYLEMRLGEYLNGTFRSRLILPQSEYLSFAASGQYWEYEENWNYQSVQFDWLPDWQEHYLQMQIRSQSLVWDSEFYSNQIKSGLVQYRSPVIYLGKDIYCDKFEFKAEVGEYQYDYDIPPIPEVLDETSGKYGEFQTELILSNSEYFMGTSYSYQREHQIVQVQLGKKVLAFREQTLFHNLAVHFWYENNTKSTLLMPTISWFSRYQIYSRWDFIFSNEPQVEQQNLSEEYAENLYIKDFSDDRLLTRRLVNLTSALQYNSFLPFTIAVNYSRYTDFNVLRENTLPLEKTFQDVDELEFSVQCAYQYKYLQLNQKISAYAGDKSKLHLQNRWQAQTKIDLIGSAWRLNLDFTYQERTIDDDFSDTLRDQLYLISLAESYDIKEFLQVQAQIQNILNIDTRDYSFLPENGGKFNFTLGFKYTF